MSRHFSENEPSGPVCHSVPEQRFIQDPYATTFGGFSKVTNFFRAALRPPDSPAYSHAAGDPGLPPQSEDEPGFELITCVREGPKEGTQIAGSSNI